MPTIEQLAEPGTAEQAAIVAVLNQYSESRGFVWRTAPLALALRDERGEIAGGLIGQLHWEWLHIQILAVAASLRGQGWGRRLMEEAERLAVAGGCRHAWLDTFSFQAPGFYERLGYRRFGELPDYPSGQVRAFFTKGLA